jgi:hypothetical protein
MRSGLPNAATAVSVLKLNEVLGPLVGTMAARVPPAWSRLAR